MIDPRLNHLCRLLDEWCVDNDISYDIVCDETDLQGVMLFKKNLQAVGALLNHLNPAIAEGNIHVEAQKVRGGTVLAFSLEAISESRLNEIIAEAGEELEPMSFVDKINLAFEAPILQEAPTEQEKVEEDIDFLESAMEMVGEAQYKTPDRGMERGHTKDRRHSNEKAFTGTERATSGVETGEKIGKSQGNKGATQGSKGVSKGTDLRYEERIANTLQVESETPKPRKFHYALHEALDGIATETGAQPGDLFKMFARALRVLGQRMGLGPLQERLKAQGISWKQSDDGQAIILTIKNAMTKTDQPIARISHETLQNPTDFEVQLKNMLDFATGDAPGAFQQKEQEIQDRKKAIGDIAKAVQPQDQESEVAQQMNLGMTDDPGNAGIGQEQAAAQTAAMPKQQTRQPQPAMQQPTM